MSQDAEFSLTQPELSPVERIQTDLMTIMGDPERIMGAERPSHSGDHLPLPPKSPRPGQEEPLAVPGADGRPLAEFQTVRDPATNGPLVIISLRSPQGRETFNYTMATGEVGHVPTSLQEPVLRGEEAQEALATRLDGLAERWQGLYGAVEVE